jgi:VanZ family protein
LPGFDCFSGTYQGLLNLNARGRRNRLPEHDIRSVVHELRRGHDCADRQRQCHAQKESPQHPIVLSQHRAICAILDRMSPKSIPVWCWWILVVLFVSFPWFGFTRDPQWKRVHTVPFGDPADKLRDVGANVLLFVPFGYSIAGRKGALAALAVSVATAALVSCAAEATQLFSTRRYPSATDIASGVLGAAGGAALRIVSRRVD